jgi:hypothetical protein
MQRRDSGPILWYATQLRPGIVASFRRWNIVIISVLLFLCMGLTVAAIVTGIERAATASKHPETIGHHKAAVTFVGGSEAGHG